MRRALVLLVGLGIIAASAGPGAADWPQFRGPTRDGIAKDLKLPAKWPDKLKENYQVEIGEGRSSPIVADGRVFVFYRDRDKEFIRCYDAKFGKKEWEHSYVAPYQPDPEAKEYGSGPRSTPAYSDGFLYSQGMSSQLICMNVKTGRPEWNKDLNRIYKSSGPLYGTAVSPMIEGNLVVTLCGGQKEGFIIGLDKKDGKEKWRTPIDGPAYGSPIATDVAGVRQILAITRAEFISVNPADGKVLWRHPYATAYEQNFVSPVVYNDYVIIGGFKKPTLALKVKKDGEKLAVSEQWANDKIRMQYSSPVVVGDYLYGHEDGGQLFCLDAKTGRPQWNKGGFGDHAALVAFGDRILVLDNKGEMTMVEANPKEFKDLGKIKTGAAGGWTQPAFGSGRLLVRGKDRFISFDMPE